MTQVFINREEGEDQKNKTKEGKRMSDSILQAHQFGLFTFRVHIILTLNWEEFSAFKAPGPKNKERNLKRLNTRSGSNKMKQLRK